MAGRRAGLSPIDEKNFWGGGPPPPYTSMARHFPTLHSVRVSTGAASVKLCLVTEGYLVQRIRVIA